jgi:hypothetical protein
MIIAGVDVVGHRAIDQRRTQIDQEMIEKLYYTSTMRCPSCWPRVRDVMIAELASRGAADAMEYASKKRKLENANDSRGYNRGGY